MVAAPNSTAAALSAELGEETPTEHLRTVPQTATRLQRSRNATLRGYESGGTHEQQSKRPVLFRPVSADRKLSPVVLEENTTDRLRPVPRAPFCSSTYVSIGATCPDSCTFKGDGCYVTEGFTGRAARRLDANAHGLSGDDVIALEALAIARAFNGGGNRGLVPQDGARGGRDLRLHVGGDVASEAGARMLAGAAVAWKLRGGGTVWTYTHRWRSVAREAWGPISVLASVETVQDAFAARLAGYAPAITLPEFPSSRTFELRERVLGASGIVNAALKVIPCPAETTGTTCVQCRLCLDRDLLSMGTAIGFALHGGGANRARRRLPVLTSAPGAGPIEATATPAPVSSSWLNASGARRGPFTEEP